MLALFSVVTLCSVAGVSAGVVNGGGLKSRQTTGYEYLPVELLYGTANKVTSNITFGTAADAEPVMVVMDTGSSSFWVSCFWLHFGLWGRVR